MQEMHLAAKLGPDILVSPTVWAREQEDLLELLIRRSLKHPQLEVALLISSSKISSQKVIKR